MFSLKSALAWGIGLVLGVSLVVASLHPDVRAEISRALTKTEAAVESSLGFAEQSSATVSSGSPARIETETELQTGVQAQTGGGLDVSTGNTSATVGTEVGATVGAETYSPSGWSLKKIFYKLTHDSYGLNAPAEAETETSASAEANP